MYIFGGLGIPKQERWQNMYGTQTQERRMSKHERNKKRTVEICHKKENRNCNLEFRRRSDVQAPERLASLGIIKAQ